MINVQLRVLDPRIVEDNFPTYATTGSAGIDLRACIDAPLTLQPGETQLVSTGISIFLDDVRYAALMLPRSGTGHKFGLVLGNGTGLIDSDYQGTLFMSLHNRSAVPYTIQPLDRCAQLIIVPVMQAQFDIVDTFTASTDRGEGGFSSTGIN